MQTSTKPFVSQKHLRSKRGAARSPALTVATDADIRRAIGFLEADKIKDALACLRPFNAGCETSPVRCNLVGLIYLSAKQNQQALKWFDRALSLDPADPEAFSNYWLRVFLCQQFARVD